MKRSELKNTLELVSLGLADGPLVPIFQCFCFKLSEVAAYNDVVGISAPCKMPDLFALHGKTLLGLVSHSNAEELDFKLQGQEVLIKADRSTFKLPFMPDADFIFATPEGKWLAELDFSDSIKDGIRACLTTVSKDQAQPALMGVYLGPGWLYGCDGDAVTRAKLETPMSEPYSCLLPNAFCSAVLKISGTTECLEGKLRFSNEWVSAVFHNGYTVYGRLIQNDKPIDFDALIEKTVKTQPTFVEVPAGLNEALARARVIADIETAPTVFTIEANRLKLLTDGRAGTVRDSLGMKHPDVQATFSAEMVQRTIGLCDEICVMENCLVGRKGSKLLQVVSCMDDKG